MSRTLVSIVINNYDYGRFLKAAVDSALAQTYPYTEVIVVDDGSTDNSPTILAGYHSRCTIELKENGGQASALNRGFALSRGSIVLFLDADDTLYPTAAFRVVEAFRSQDEQPAKVHFLLDVTDEMGNRTGQVVPGSGVPRPRGDLSRVILDRGPAVYLDPHPTTANAFARSALAKVMPIPEENYAICADAYLLAAVPFFGVLTTLDDVLGTRRVHSANRFLRKEFDVRSLREEHHFALARNTDIQRLIRRTKGRSIDTHQWTTPRQRTLELLLARLDSEGRSPGDLRRLLQDVVQFTFSFRRWPIYKRLKYALFSMAVAIAPRDACFRLARIAYGKPLGDGKIERAEPEAPESSPLHPR